MLVRKARLQDASHIYDLVNSLSTDGTLLKRAFAEICEFNLNRWTNVALWAKRMTALPGFQAPFDLLAMADAELS